MINYAHTSTVVDLPFQGIDLARAFSAKPPKLDYVLSGLIAGSIGLLIAPGGIGKSTLVNYIAAHISSGYDPLGFGPTKVGEVLLLAAEDPEIILWHRSNQIGKNMNQQAWDFILPHNFIIFFPLEFKRTIQQTINNPFY